MSMAMACILSIVTFDRLDRGDNKGFRKPEHLCINSQFVLKRAVLDFGNYITRDPVAKESLRSGG